MCKKTVLRMVSRCVCARKRIKCSDGRSLCTQLVELTGTAVLRRPNFSLQQRWIIGCSQWAVSSARPKKLLWESNTMWKNRQSLHSSTKHIITKIKEGKEEKSIKQNQRIIDRRKMRENLFSTHKRKNVKKNDNC